jgi:hypothetical protein
MKPENGGRPRIVFLHYTAPPIVGGVEAVIAEHRRLFQDAGFPTLLLAGRAAPESAENAGDVVVIPEMDSENLDYLEIHQRLEKGDILRRFSWRAAQACGLVP